MNSLKEQLEEIRVKWGCSCQPNSQLQLASIKVALEAVVQRSYDLAADPEDAHLNAGTALSQIKKELGI